MEKRIRLFTHGEKVRGVDPKMTPKGKADVASLAGYSSQNIGRVYCGSGHRHLDVAKALGFTRFFIDDAFGNGDNAEVIDGKAFAICEDGREVPLKEHTWLKDNYARGVERMSKLEDGDVVCAGRPTGIMLKMAGIINFDFVDTAVYEILIKNGKITSVELIQALGKIDSVLQSSD